MPQPLVRSIDWHADLIFKVCVSPDLSFFVSGGKDRCLKVWDSHTLQQRYSFRVTGEVVYMQYCIYSIMFAVKSYIIVFTLVSLFYL
eukprot:GILI01038913.1.p1 GENE.GILI01038913.1~~GILI01038913.1.p1  ORF type:complete len:101 (+),score=0.90 GILI01038913.1:45-305(+)